jgi:hypothetical protein
MPAIGARARASAARARRRLARGGDRGGDRGGATSIESDEVGARQLLVFGSFGALAQHDVRCTMPEGRRKPSSRRGQLERRRAADARRDDRELHLR